MSGKGSKPRNCYTPAFREGYDAIDWSVKPARKGLTTEPKPDSVEGYDNTDSSVPVIPPHLIDRYRSAHKVRCSFGPSHE